MNSGEKMEAFDVCISKVKKLELRVDDGGDGCSGDFAVWSDVNIDYEKLQASAITTETTAEGEGVSKEDWDRMSSKINRLPVSDYPSMKRSDIDWLVSPDSYKAEVMAGADGKSIIITNGLTSRVFRITPNLATVDISLMKVMSR